MCFDPSASPPDPPRTGLLAESTRLVLAAEDGNRLAARLATTKEQSAPGIVLLPDVRGLHLYYEELADRVAEVGAHAVAIDLYGRTAGAEYRGHGFDFAPHRAAVTDALVRVDVTAALHELRARGASRAFVGGFCFGGRAAFMQASRDDVDGVIGFYGWPVRREEGGSSPVEEARQGRVRAPVLAIYGGADEGITEPDRQAYDDALARAGVRHETVVYPGAPHSFFDRHMDRFDDACRDAWGRVLAFVGLA